MASEQTSSGKTFDESKGYQKKELDSPYYNDGREIGLLHFVYSHPKLESLRNSPQNVLAAIDEYGRTKKYLMNVGEDKGKIVSDIIAEVKPAVMVELGAYVGYSAILFADASRRAGGKAYYCLEHNPEFAAVVASLVDLAGLSDFVKVIVGGASDSFTRLNKEGVLTHIDLLFLDHIKPLYGPDLRLAEELGMVGKGTVLCADNVIYPGNPEYLEYVRSSVQQKRAVPARSEEARKGNPNLIYKSELKESFEPTGEKDGVEVTRCLGEEAAA